jgi:hypothetical protein
MREDDFGLLWEHWVLDEIHSRLQTPIVRYWRDKRGHEVDFILALRGRDPIGIECKWMEKHFEPTNLAAFRKQYPGGQNWIVCQDVDQGFSRQFDTLQRRVRIM